MTTTDTTTPLPRLSADPPGSLGQRAADRRKVLAVLSEPCAAHRASAGTPCWEVIPGWGGDPLPAMCGPRIARVFPAPESTQTIEETP